MRYGLYIITDELLVPGLSHTRIAEEALAGGADVIQLRDKTRSGAELFAVAKEISSLCSQSGALFIVNDRLDIALASGAGGVHLGQDDLPLEEARKIVPRSFIIGVSVGTVAEAERAEKDGADYLGVGPVYQTGTKTDAGPAVGPDLLRQIRRRVSIPIVAIGGITCERVPEVIASGADGVAVISAVICSRDIAATSRRFADLVGSALSRR